MLVTIIGMAVMFACVVAGYSHMTNEEANNDESVYSDQWSFEL